MKLRITHCLLLALLGFGPCGVMATDLPPVESAEWTSEYDDYFRKYSKRYFGAHFDWRWFKAQAIAESRLDPQARSHAGAQGLMQIMPATFYEIKEANPHFSSLGEPRWNIAAGIYYDRMLFRKWRQNISEQQRLMMAFASYNAGLGSIRRAYRQSPEPVTAWDDIAPRAPKETQGYVSRIRSLRGRKPRSDEPATKGIWHLLAEKMKRKEAP